MIYDYYIDDNIDNYHIGDYTGQPNIIRHARQILRENLGGSGLLSFQPVSV